MFYAHRRAAFACAVALLAAANASAANAGEEARFYAARYELDSPSGIVRASETLGVGRRDATPFVSVSDTSGALVSLPTELAADGEIVANSFDPSVTCYNMAAAALFASRSVPARPAFVYVRFGDATLAVPLTLSASNASDGDATLAGSGTAVFSISNASERLPAGIVVEASIATRDGVPSDVAFKEATLVGSPARIVSVMTCSLARAQRTIPKPVKPAAPVAVLPG